MEKSYSPSFLGTLSNYTGGAVSSIRNTTGSVVAGVGSYVPNFSRAELKRPDIIDPTSQESFDAFKRYNVATNAAASDSRMWANTIDKVLGYIMFGAVAAFSGAMALNPFSYAALAFPAAIFIGALTLSVGASVYFRRSADTEITAKSMDVNDFHSQREAALIGKEVAKEVKKIISEEKAPKKDANPCLEARPQVSQISLQGVQMEISGQQRLN